MVERVDVAARVVMVAAYVAVCAGVLWVMFPGARQVLVRAYRSQRYAYELGMHRARYARTQAVWAALGRGDLPDEPAA